MKTFIAAAALLTALSVCADEGSIISVNAILKDNSTLKGELTSKNIAGSTIFKDKLDLDAAMIKSIVFSGTNGESKVELVNGDKFAMTVANENFAIKSMLGELAIPRANFKSIALSARKSSAGAADNGLIFHCTFDNAATLSSPEVGPAVKLELGKIREQDGRHGGALFVNPGIAGAEIAFPEGSFGPEGCIEFWANMASGKTEFSTGGDPRFFILIDDKGSEKAHFEYASNNGCGNSGLGGHFLGMRTQTNSGARYLMPYSDVFKGEDYNGWHHYAFVWTPTSIAIYLDGKLLCRNSGCVNPDEMAHSAITMDIPLNRITGKSFNNKSAFYMDDLKIWNFAKREFDLN